MFVVSSQSVWRTLLMFYIDFLSFKFLEWFLAEKHIDDLI